MSRLEFVVTLRPEGPGDEASAYRRMRAALKLLLRTFGLRCIDFRRAEPAGQAEGNPGTGQPA